MLRLLRFVSNVTLNYHNIRGTYNHAYNQYYRVTVALMYPTGMNAFTAFGKFVGSYLDDGGKTLDPWNGYSRDPRTNIVLKDPGKARQNSANNLHQTLSAPWYTWIKTLIACLANLVNLTTTRMHEVH